MTLSVPTVTGADYLDLKELTANGPVLAVFRIRSFEEPEMGDYGAYKVPVIADVFIASGPRQGEVHKSERFIGAPTNALRGVKNPKKGEMPEPPTTVVGQEIAARVNLVERRGSQPFVGLDVPSQPEFEAIAAAYEAAGGKALWDAPAAPAAAPPLAGLAAALAPGAPAAPAAAPAQPAPAQAAPQGEARPPWAAAPQAEQAQGTGQGIW